MGCGPHHPRRISSFSQALVTTVCDAQDRYILDRVSSFIRVQLASILLYIPSHTTHTAHNTMFRPKSSAPVKSFLPFASPSSSDSVPCGCPECEQAPATPRQSLSRRSLTSPSEPLTPTTSSVWHFLPFSKELRAYDPGQHQRPPSPTELLKQQRVQMTSMGYSNVFTLGYLSASVSPFSLRSLSQIH